MTKKSSTPAIRFKGFTDTWEQRKLGNVANYRRGSFPQPYGKSEWYDGDGAMPFVQVADVSDEMNLVENTKQKISMLAQPMSVFAGKNTVLVTLQGSIGRVAITQYGAFVDRTVLIFEKYKEKIDTTFWAYIVKQKFIDEARKAPGGTIKTITKEALSDFDLSIPNYKEQQQIGTFFKQLDNLITLHQRKYDKLTNVKKSMLEKMFPKNGSNVPEIRFKGFTEAWEQRKLGDVAKYRNGKAHENDISEQGKFIVVNSKFVSTNGEVRKFSNKQIEPLFKNEIAFVLSDVPNGRAIARTFLVDKNDKYTLNQRIAGITPIEGTCPYFLHILMNRNKYFLQFDDGAKQTNLSVDDVIEFAEYYPSSEEQQQIGNFFRQLDNLITLHQRELEKLKNLKKACLEKMFV